MYPEYRTPAYRWHGPPSFEIKGARGSDIDTGGARMASDTDVVVVVVAAAGVVIDVFVYIDKKCIKRSTR